MIDYPTAFSPWHPGDGGPEDRAYACAYLSGRLTMGPETEAFEAAIATYHGRRHAIAVNSGSSANEIALAAFRERYYPTYLEGPYEGPLSASVPSVAWATTYGPCYRNGYGDFDLRDADDTWNSPLSPLRESGVSYHSWSYLYVACPILGNPLADYAKLAALKLEHPSGCPTLEDNCESLGARTADGRLTGTFGDLSTGSGFFSHQLSAIELGWVLTDDDELARLCRLLRNHGNAGWSEDHPLQRYRFEVFGYNVRPLETHCAAARAGLPLLDERNAERRAHALVFRALTSSLPIAHQRWTSPYVAPFGLAFECESAPARHRLVRALRAAGIDSRPPTGGSFTRHLYGAPWRDQPTPRADRLHDTGLFLGNAPYPIPHLIERAVKVMKDTL